VRRAASTVAAGLGAAHALWATGSPWPFKDRQQLANAVVGGRAFPGPAWCLAVSGTLLGGAIFAPRLLAVAFAGRGVVGLVRPDLLPAGDQQPFGRLNTRLYSPGCLLLAAALAR
jgi:hypothetical protein